VTSHGDRPTPTGAPTVRDRARGALIGAGLGDAVGAVFEGGPPVPDPALDAVLDGDAPLRFTDDTALTMALARSLVEVGDLDPDHLAAAFVDAYRADPGRGYGSGMRHWCDQVGRGVPWAAAAAGQFGGRGSFGNGAAMRVAPAAVLAISDPFRALRLAATQAAVTHAHPVAVDGARVTIEGLVDGRPRGLEFRPGRPPRAVDADRTDGFAVTVRGSGRRPAEERRLLREACRHSLRPIFLDGERINHGLLIEGCLMQVDLLNPRLQSTVGLPMESDLVRIKRLRHGVLVEEVVRAPVNGMVFHAVTDEKDDDLDATWNTLRRSVRKLYVKLAGRLQETTADSRPRAVRLLLDRFSHSREASLLLGVPLFPRLGNKSSLDLESVRRLAATERIYALAPHEPSRGFDVEARTVLRLGGHERRFLERELAIHLAAPPRRGPGLRLGPARKLGKRWRALTRALSGPGRPVADDDLSAEELGFIELLRAEVRSGAFSLAADIGNPFHVGLRFAANQRRPLIRVERKDGRVEFRVARSHPLVERCVEAAAVDPSWIYPVLLLLAEGRDGWADTRVEAQRAILSRHQAT